MMPCVLLALKSGACSRMRGMRDSMRHVVSPRDTGLAVGLRGVVSRLAFKHEGTRGVGRLRVDEIVCQDSKLAIRTRNTPAACSSDRQLQQAEPRVVRGVSHSQEEAVGRWLRLV